MEAPSPDTEVSLPTGILLTAEEIGRLLKCSTRSVRRLTDRGALPKPLRFGGLIRWRRTDIDDWLAAGCPSIRKTVRR